MRAEKTNKKKEQGAETKRRLYESAEGLFAKHDFASVSVEDITDATGITKGAFYVHFESKDALIADLIADHSARADADYAAFLDALPPDTPADETLLALVKKIAEVLVGTIGYENMRKVYELMLAGTVDLEAVKGYGRELYRLFYGVLERGISRGELRADLSPELLCRNLVTAFRGVTYEWCIRQAEFDLRGQAETLFRLLLDGMRA